MITIFQGRKLSLDGTQDQIYANIAVTMRDQIHLFNTGKSLNPFAIFMCIALHSDANGWAYPSRDLLKRETGFSSDETIGRSLKHLRKIKLDGYRFLEMYRQYDQATKRWGRTVYRIFPDAFGKDMSTAPKPNLVLWNPENPPPYIPGLDNPDVDYPELDNGGYNKENHNKEKPSKEKPEKVNAPRISPNGDDSLIGIKIIEPRDIQTEYVEVPLYEKSYEIICPECNHHQPWPKSNRERKKKVTLTCKGCGVIWKVVIDYNTGGRDEYKVPLPRQEWTIILDDAIPNLGNELVCDENECQQFVANWRENPSRVVEKLQWAAKEEWLRHQRLKIVARVNAAYETTTKKELSESQQQQQKGEPEELLPGYKFEMPDWMK